MSDELRRNPDTGDVERKVVSYEKVEQAQLQGEVDTHQQTVDQKNQREQELQTELEQVQADRSAAETALADAKSQLEAYNQVTPAEPTSDDSGEETAESPVEEAAEGESVEVTVENAAVEGETPVF